MGIYVKLNGFDGCAEVRKDNIDCVCNPRIYKFTDFAMIHATVVLKTGGKFDTSMGVTLEDVEKDSYDLGHKTNGVIEFFEHLLFKDGLVNETKEANND